MCVKVEKILTDNPRMIIDCEAALVIKTITNTPIEIPEGTEVIDVCKAVETMLNESEAKGIELGMEIGEIRMLVKLVRKGRVTVEEAAEAAKMTVEEFKKVIENITLQNV